MLEEQVSGSPRDNSGLGRGEAYGTVVWITWQMLAMNQDSLGWGTSHFRLDNLLLNEGLDRLMDMADRHQHPNKFSTNRQNSLVDMLALDHRRTALRVRGALDVALIAQLASLGTHGALGALVVAVVKLAVDGAGDLGSVLLGHHLGGLDRLDGAVVVVLVHLLVDGGVDLLMLGGLDGLVLDGWRRRLVDCGVMTAGLVHELADDFLGLLHVGGIGGDCGKITRY